MPKNKKIILGVLVVCVLATAIGIILLRKQNCSQIISSKGIKDCIGQKIKAIGILDCNTKGAIIKGGLPFLKFQDDTTLNFLEETTNCQNYQNQKVGVQAELYECGRGGTPDQCAGIGLKDIKTISIISTSTTPQNTTISITTDKAECKQGETVKITVRNNFNKSIWYGKASNCGTSFWILQKKEEDKWGDVESLKEGGCRWPAPPPPVELQPRGTVEDQWSTFKYFSGASSKGSELIEPGIYRFVFSYFPNCTHPQYHYECDEPIKVYSNEFTLSANANTSQEPKTTIASNTDEEINRAIWNASGNNYEYPIILKDISLPQLIKVFPHHRFIQAELGKTLPPSYTIVATDKVAKSNVYILPDQFNALLVENKISIEDSNLIDVAKAFALMASPKVISQLSFVDQSPINETIKGLTYHVKLTTYSKINGIKEEWKFGIQDHQIQSVRVKTIDVQTGDYIEDIDGPFSSKGSIKDYNLEIYSQN